MKYLGAISNDLDLVNKKYVDDAVAGAGGITTETDPVFSASAAAGISASDITNWNGKTSNTGTVTSITLKAGSGITLDTDNTAITTSGTRTISHTDTSSQASVSNSGRTYIQSITLDDYGHVTGLTSATETVTDSDTKVSTAAVTSGTQYYPTVGTNTTSAATKYYDVDYGYYASTGTTSTVGYGRLKLGNTTASGTAGNKYGLIRMCGTGAYYIDLRAQSVASNKTLTLPDYTGTLLAYNSSNVTNSVVAMPANTAYTTAYVRNIIESTSAPGSTSAVNGTVWLKYGDSTLPTMADYVVEQSIAASPEDNWSYVKWNSGKAECWIEKKYSSQAITTAWGSCYYADLGTVSFPFTFVTTASSSKFPFVQITSKATGGRCWIIENTGTSLTGTGVLYAIAPQSYSNAGSVLARIYVVGLWK